ncbi:hypothetical protein J5X84_36030 [Streptosporangiaceae bacterium NEAU-GS5]|nr:hypothetical protein [Streptosporangiaceae bacterium NEAU-GS5]
MDERWLGSDDAMTWTSREVPPLPDDLLAELEERYGPITRWTAEQCAEIGPERIEQLMAWVDRPDVRALLEQDSGGA